jgi:hypothetical protein
VVLLFVHEDLFKNLGRQNILFGFLPQDLEIAFSLTQKGV